MTSVVHYLVFEEQEGQVVTMALRCGLGPGAETMAATTDPTRVTCPACLAGMPRGGALCDEIMPPAPPGAPQAPNLPAQ